MSPDNKCQYNMACDIYVIQAKDGIRELNVYDNRKEIQKENGAYLATVKLAVLSQAISWGTGS